MTSRTREILTIEDIESAFAPILRQAGAKKAIVFGSYARGDADEHSDLDLIVVTETNRKFFDRDNDFGGLYDVWRKGIDLLIYTPGELAAMLAEGRAFIEIALEQGVVLYEDSPSSSSAVAPGNGKETQDVAETDMERSGNGSDAGRWLAAAEVDLRIAGLVLREQFYSHAMFMAHQVAEKALKALAYQRGDRYVTGHSLVDLAANLESTYRELGIKRKLAKSLDKYYLPTRYPDALPGGIPSEVYDDQEEAERAVEGSEEFVNIARSEIAA